MMTNDVVRHWHVQRGVRGAFIVAVQKLIKDASMTCVAARVCAHRPALLLDLKGTSHLHESSTIIAAS